MSGISLSVLPKTGRVALKEDWRGDLLHSLVWLVALPQGCER
ncbi:hypothetical protein [Methyloglobulus sp.]